MFSKLSAAGFEQVLSRRQVSEFFLLTTCQVVMNSYWASSLRQGLRQRGIWGRLPATQTSTRNWYSERPIYRTKHEFKRHGSNEM